MFEDFYQKNTFIIVSYFSAHYERSDLFEMKINTIQNQTSINVIPRLQRKFTWLKLFLARSRLFQLAVTSSELFYCLQATKSQKILTFSFTINQLLSRSVRVFIKQDSFSELQSGIIFAAKSGNNYKVVQYKRQMKETKEIDIYNLLLHSPLICLATDTLRLGILEKLKL